jgi:hypothetical protein
MRVATTGTAATPTVAPAGGMGSGCVVAAAIMAHPTTGTAVTIEGAGRSAVDAVLGCTAAVGMVGGAKRERDTHPSKLSGTCGIVGSTTNQITGDRAATSPQCGWVGTAIDLRVFVPVNT